MLRVTNYCRLCLGKNIKIGLKLAPMPVGEKFFKKKIQKKKLKKFPISLGWCQKCNNVQTMEIINPEFLWQDFTYLSAQTKAIVDHFGELSSLLIKRFKLTKKDLVVDIGSNDGTFLKFFKKKKIKVLGVDPAKNVAKIAIKNKINTIVEFFDLGTSKKIVNNFGFAKLILCFNTFAHSENLREIVNGISKTLAQNGIFVFECQYLHDIYKKKIIGTIFHEHLYHHSLTSLKSLFQLYGLEIFDVKMVNIQKGSILGFVCKKNQFSVNKNVKKLLELEHFSKDTSFIKLRELKRFINLQKSHANKILKKFKKKDIAIYGAARSGPTLAYNYSIDRYPQIIFDDHPLKVGRYSSMGSLFVRPTRDLLKINPKICIVLAYLHLKNILKKNKKYIQRGGKFLSVYPKIELISKKNYKKFV